MEFQIALPQSPYPSCSQRALSNNCRARKQNKKSVQSELNNFTVRCNGRNRRFIGKQDGKCLRKELKLFSNRLQIRTEISDGNNQTGYGLLKAPVRNYGLMQAFFGTLSPSMRVIFPFRTCEQKRCRVSGKKH